MENPPTAVYAEPVSSFNSVLVRSRAKPNTQRAYIIPVITGPIVKVLNYIAQFRSLKDNWDGYGAAAPSAAAILMAKDFANLLPLKFLNKLSIDDIVPTTHGTVLFEWNVKGNYVIGEVGDKKIALISNIDSSPKVILDEFPFNGQSLPDEINQELIKLYRYF